MRVGVAWRKAQHSQSSFALLRLPPLIVIVIVIAIVIVIVIVIVISDRPVRGHTRRQEALPPKLRACAAVADREPAWGPNGIKAGWAGGSGVGEAHSAPAPPSSQTSSYAQFSCPMVSDAHVFSQDT